MLPVDLVGGRNILMAQLTHHHDLLDRVVIQHLLDMVVIFHFFECHLRRIFVLASATSSRLHLRLVGLVNCRGLRIVIATGIAAYPFQLRHLVAGKRVHHIFYLPLLSQIGTFRNSLENLRIATTANLRVVVWSEKLLAYIKRVLHK